MEAIDFGRKSNVASRQFGQEATPTRLPIAVAQGDLHVPSKPQPEASASTYPVECTLDDDKPGFTRHMGKIVGTNNLVDFVKDKITFIVWMIKNVQNILGKSVLALDVIHKSLIVLKKTITSNMDKMLYKLEVPKTANMDNMTNVLLTVANSIHDLMRLVSCLNTMSYSFEFFNVFLNNLFSSYSFVM